MGKAHRSPLLGYNHNVGHLGHVFHVQTEDSFPAAPRLFTHLFYEGTILVSRKVEYEAMTPDDQVRALMQGQHRTVIKDMTTGTFNERIVTFFRARGVTIAAPPVQVAATVAAGPVAATVVDAPIPPVNIPAVISVQPIQPDEAAPVHVPRRTTRPIEAQRPRKPPQPQPAPISVRPPEPRRPPFVRSDMSPVAKTTSADGVVVQRSVVVGGTSPSDPRQRIRPPVPYVVTGGTHPVRHVPLDNSVDGHVDNSVHSDHGPVIAPATASADGPSRAAGAFGPSIPDDKSLDEVILEYLSEDGD